MLQRALSQLFSNAAQKIPPVDKEVDKGETHEVRPRSDKRDVDLISDALPSLEVV